MIESSSCLTKAFFKLLEGNENFPKKFFCRVVIRLSLQPSSFGEKQKVGTKQSVCLAMLFRRDLYEDKK
jgi:hypothetical protein